MPGNKIVIVDDQMETTRMIRKNLETLGQDFEISHALSGEEALLDLSRTRIDLLIADFRLPGISGLTLMDKYKVTNPGGKVILVSGVTDQKIRQQVAQAGADAFFFKPIDMPEFLDAVERCLGLVNTILPPELQLYTLEAVEGEGLDDADSHAGMTDQISDLRSALDAVAVLLVSDQGEILFRAGELPDPVLETALMPVLMRAFTAGVRISHFLGQHTPDHFFSFRGENYDLFLVPVGDSHCLMVLTRPMLPKQMGRIAEHIYSTSRSVLLSLSRLGILFPGTGSLDVSVLPDTGSLRQPTGDPVSADTGPLEDESLEEMFTSGKHQALSDADGYWETLSSEDIKPELSSGDSLSYDQASKLGLAPSEDS